MVVTLVAWILDTRYTDSRTHTQREEFACTLEVNPWPVSPFLIYSGYEKRITMDEDSKNGQRKKFNAIRDQRSEMKTRVTNYANYSDQNENQPDRSFIPIGYLTVCSFTAFLTNNFVFFMNSLAGYSSIKFALNFISVFFARIGYIVKGAPFLQVNLWQSEQLTSFHLYSWPRRNPRVWTQSSFFKLFGWWLAQ